MLGSCPSPPGFLLPSSLVFSTQSSSITIDWCFLFGSSVGSVGYLRCLAAQDLYQGRMMMVTEATNQRHTSKAILIWGYCRYDPARMLRRHNVTPLTATREAV